MVVGASYTTDVRSLVGKCCVRVRRAASGERRVGAAVCACGVWLQASSQQKGEACKGKPI